MTADCLPDCSYCHPEPKACVKCLVTIPRAVEHRNLDGGMRLELHGWYGGTIDPFRPVGVWLCHPCASVFLRDNNAWLAKPLSEGRG